MAAPQASSRLEMLQARFQQKQLQEKEQKLLQLYDQQQQRAYQVVQRNSAGSGGSNHGGSTVVRTTTHTTSTSQGGKVRQMFDERRHTKGIDRSYPLEPLENKLRKQTNMNGVTTQRNGNLTTVNRQSVSVKRVARADVNSNINGGKPVVSYHEEISRESFGPPVHHHDDEDEFGVENRVATFPNGYYRHEADDEQEDALDQETMERNRMMAKIHLMGFDESLKHRVRNDLESEEFPEFLMVDVPDKLSKRNVTKKLSQAEARLERFKNANAKRSNMPKQSTPTSNMMKKRSEQTVSTKANSRRSEIAGTSPTSIRSGSSRTTERSQRILENAKNPLSRIRVVDETSERRRESSDIETFSRRDSSQSFSRKATKTDNASRIYPSSNGFKSVTSDGKIFVRRSASPQFFCRESERSATTMSIGRQSDSSGSPLFHRGTETKRRSPFLFNEFEQSRKTNESKSPVWDREISLRKSVSPQYLQESKRSETVLNTDREITDSKSSEWNKETLTKQKSDFKEKLRTSTSLDRKTSFKSPSYEEEVLKKRSSSPQFFCKESERSGTTMSIDRGESRSSLHDQETLTKRSTSPQYFFGEFEQYRGTSESKSPIWERGISSRQSVCPQYLHHESKQSKTALSTDRETTGSKSSEWSKQTLTKQKTDFDTKLRTSSLDRKTSSKTPSYEEEVLKKRSSSPQFFCKESEKSGTTMSIDRAVSASRSSYDQGILKRQKSPFFLRECERYRRTSESKSPICDKRILSRQSATPQYLHHESKRSETALSTGRETAGSKSSEWSKETLTKQKSDFERKLRSTSLDRKTSSKSPSYEEEILKKRSSRPQFFCKESERSGTTMSIDRAVNESRSSLYDQETLTRQRSPFFLRECERYRRSESKSPICDRGILSRQSTTPQYFHYESKRSKTGLSTDRKTTGSKSSEWSKETLTKQKTDFDTKLRTNSLDRKTLSETPSYEQEVLKKRSSSPQFFCKESEKSDTTMSIDRAVNESRSSLYDQETLMRRRSPFFLSESERYRRTSESKSPICDRGISSKQSATPRHLHHESKRSKTALSTDRKTIGSKSSKWSKETLTKQKTDFDRKLRTSTSLDRKTLSKTPSYEEEVLKKRSSSPQFFCKESERSGTTMTIDHAIREPRSSSHDRETLIKQRSPFFLSEFERYRRTSESGLPICDRELSSKQSTSPQYLHHESKRSETALSTDRETAGAKSSEWSKKILTKQKAIDFDRKLRTSSLDRKTSSKSYEEEILKKRSSSPQFFCKESERSGTTMSIDYAVREPISSSYDREMSTKRRSPFFLNESEQYRKTSESKSPIWDKRISSRQSSSPQYLHHESKRSETALSTDRETTGSKSSEWSKEILTKQKAADFDRKLRTSSLDRKISSKLYGEEILKKRSSSPQFFCKESERSGTTMSIDHAVKEPRSSSYDRETKRSTAPLYRKTEQRSTTTASIDRRYGASKSFGAARGKRTTRPQFFCKESEKSATTMLIEPRSRDNKSILKQRNYTANVSHKRSMKPLPSISTKISSTRDRHTPSPSITKQKEKKALRENKVSSTATETRRSKISETSATSSSSIVSLKYGMEFDNILQSAGLVRKFMKSHDEEQHKVHQSKLSSSKDNTKDINYIIRDNQSRSQYKTSPLFQKATSPSMESRKRATPESPRKSLTPTEVDMEIQEITMTDHRMERDKIRKATPIPKRQINGTYTRSSNNRTKFKTSITYPVRKTQRQRASILESNVLKSKRHFSDEESKDHRSSDRYGEESAISLSKLDCSPVSESSQRIITRVGEDESQMSEAKISQTWNRSVKNQAGNVAIQSEKHEDRRRSTSRSPNQTRIRTAKEKTGGSKTTSPDSFRGRKYSGGMVSRISYDSEKRTKGTRSKFDKLQSLRSTHLVQGALKDKNLSADDVYNRGRSEDRDENVAVDKVDAGIDIKYRTVVETLNEKIGDRKIARRNSADQITNKKVSPRGTTRASMKSNTSKRTISSTKDCGRQHDIKFRISTRVSPLRRSAEISRGADTKISPSQRVVSKADQSTKFFTYTVKDCKRESALNAKKLMESSNKMNTKRKIKESEDATREFSKTRRDDKSEKNFERMDSVESALKRFDSIGAEFEHSGPTSFQASSEISLKTMDTQANISARQPIASEESTVIPPCEVTTSTTLRSTLKSPVGKDLKVKNVRKSDSRFVGRQIRSSNRLKKIGDSTENKQRSMQTRSPTCKRRLFESDWQRKIEGTRSKSSYAKTHKKENYSSASFRFRKDKTVSKVRSSNDLDCEIAKRQERSEETPTFSVRALRSIEDIRKSIDNERDVLIATGESRSAIANWRSASREGVDARGSIPATDAARNVFLGGDPARLTKVKSCVSRITKSPSPDSAARKQHETNTRATRGSAPTSPSKSPDIASRRSIEPKNQEAKSSRKSAIAKGADSMGNKATTTGTVDTVDGVVLQDGSLHEFTTKRSNAFVIDFDDRLSKEDDAIPPRKSSTKKSVDKQQTVSSASGRPTSSVSSHSSAGSTQSQVSSTKGKMTTKAKISAAYGSQAKGPLPLPKHNSTSAGNLVPCNICGRRFTRDRIDYHETICTKNNVTKKRKPFDSVMTRVKGTELEPFVKKNLCKKDNSRTEKLQIKSRNWRRQHEDFINTIRSAKQVQAHLAAGGNLSDLPPPPPSDTSDYIQCPHCGRKFNSAAAERHIPKCQHMFHNKPAHTRAPRR